jgi:hypothetical protein
MASTGDTMPLNKVPESRGSIDLHMRGQVLSEGAVLQLGSVKKANTVRAVLELGSGLLATFAYNARESSVRVRVQLVKVRQVRVSDELPSPKRQK